MIELKNHLVRSFALIFNGRKYRRGLTVLEIVQIPKNIITRELRDKPRILDKIISPEQKQYLFYHLLPLADEIQQLSYEIAISKYQVKIRIYISHRGNLIEDELIQNLRYKSDLIEAAYKSSFKNIEFKNLVDKDLYNAWSEILEYGNYNYKLIGNDIIEIDRITNNLYLAILYLDSIAPIKANMPLTQIDQLINNLLSNNINCHYISVIKPDSKYVFSEEFEENSQLKLSSSGNRFSNNQLNDKIHEQLLNIRHSEFIQMWNTSTYIVLKASDIEKLRRNIEKAKIIFKNIFSDSKISGSVKLLYKKKLENALSKIAMRDGVNNIKLSSEHAIATLHLPESVVPSINTSMAIPIFEIPPKSEEMDKKKIKIGKILLDDRSLYDMYVDLEELRLNMFIVGQVGMGKTEFTKNFLSELYKADPNVNWIVLEWKGDYKDLITRIPEPIQVVSAGSNENPLRLNMFNPSRANPENHAMKLYSIFKEIFKSSYTSHINISNYELSPQMEKITKEILLECVRNPEKRTFKSFFHELKNYENKFYDKRNTSISMSIAAIENRFQRFSSGILGKILNVEKSNINFEQIMNKKIIFDLSSIIYKQGTKDDVRLLINLILKYVIDQALRRGPTNDLKHIVILEDSQLLVPEILREVPETTLGEDIPLLLRSVGEAMISIATRPRISPDIISNSAIKVTFKLNQADDTLKIAKYQNLNEDQEKYLRFLKKQEAIVSTLNFPYPFRIKTITSPLKNISDEEIVQHNLQYFPEMFEKEENIKSIKNKTEITEKMKSTTAKNLKEKLNDWELKRFENLNNDFKEVYLQLKEFLNKPRTKEEISEELKLNKEDTNKYLTKFKSLKLISFDFFPDFNSEVSLKCYHLIDNKNYINIMIKKKLKEDFYKPGFIKDSDVTYFDYLTKNNYYIKIFSNKINETNKHYFKELFFQWDKEIKKKRMNGLIILVPYISSIDSINRILDKNYTISIKIIAYNKKYWQELHNLINANSGSNNKKGNKKISKKISQILDNIEELNSIDIKKEIFNLDEKNKNLIDENGDIFQLLNKFQKKIKNDLEN
ncbi:MAG: ATP-binding protein [Candidatus Helarchaeota archaeon]